MVESFRTTPRLALSSPEPGSANTEVLDVLDLLTPEPMFVFSDEGRSANDPTIR